MSYFDSVVLKIYGQNTCKNCDEQIDIDCLTFDTSPTDAGTEHFTAEIKCGCGEEIKSISDYEHVSTVREIMEYFDKEAPFRTNQKINFSETFFVNSQEVYSNESMNINYYVSNYSNRTVKVYIEVKEV